MDNMLEILSKALAEYRSVSHREHTPEALKKAGDDLAVAAEEYVSGQLRLNDLLAASLPTDEIMNQWPRPRLNHLYDDPVSIPMPTPDNRWGPKKYGEPARSLLNRGLPTDFRLGLSPAGSILLGIGTASPATPDGGVDEVVDLNDLDEDPQGLDTDPADEASEVDTDHWVSNPDDSQEVNE